MFPIDSAVPIRYPPFVVYALIAINAIVFLFELSLPPRALEAFLQHWALVPLRYSDPSWAWRHGLDPENYLPFFTNMYLHGGWFHILSNMWTLWIFGPAVEDRLGKVRFFIFYTACGIGASLAHALTNIDSAIPALGASGAIAGVIGAYMRLFPHARVIVLVPILLIPFFFEVPAAIFAAIWFFTQVVQGVGALFAPAVGGGVAWWAHIGGFAVGWAIIRQIQRSERRHRRYFADEGKLGFDPAGYRRRRTP